MVARMPTGNPNFKPHEPSERDRGLVEGMAACGETAENISRVLGIGVTTLRKYYQTELDTAYIRANAKVAQTLFALATGAGDWKKANPACAMFWAKTRLGWRETARLEHTGENGGAVRYEKVDLVRLDEQSLLTIEKLLIGHARDPED